jgi:hypothetical protein
MELAGVDAGHYVAWGELIQFDLHEAENKLRDYVTNSLNRFWTRDGRDQSGRLDLRRYPALHREFQLVSIRSLLENTFEAIPHERTAIGYQRRDDYRVTFSSEIAPLEFFAIIDRLFPARPLKDEER